LYGPYGVPIEFLTVIICTLFTPKAAISGEPSVSVLTSERIH
jgi:hypothetical protein